MKRATPIIPQDTFTCHLNLVTFDDVASKLIPHLLVQTSVLVSIYGGAATEPGLKNCFGFTPILIIYLFQSSHITQLGILQQFENMRRCEK